MFNLSSIFNKPKETNSLLNMDSVAEILKVSPEALKSFEESYSKHALNAESDNFFEINAKQATEEKHSTELQEQVDKETLFTILKMEQKIVEELLVQTETYVYGGKTAPKTENWKSRLSITNPVTNDEIRALPEYLRPQLTGNLMKVDIGEKSYPALLYFYQEALKNKNPKTRKDAYHRFRQGLDILDLDAVTYEIIGTNPNSMGHWFPQLVKACAGQEFFKLPATTIAKVPLTLLQLTRQEYMGLSQTTLNIVDQWAQEAFHLDGNKEYFIKTGTYSSKFDFRNAYVHGKKEVRELGEYLLYIHFQALQMASPLSKPCIYGVSTTNEWVVREFIKDKENNPCIYKGLPLHTEYRVFVDCDTDKVIGISPYWEPKTMKKRFGHSEDSDSPHQMHDYVIYKAHEEKLMQRYDENKDKVKEQIEILLPNLNLKGQWSMDIMQNGDDFWIIDMALAENSAFYDCVPIELRNPSEENWIPKLPGATTE